MGFKLIVEGNETLTYGKDIIQFVNVALSTQGDSRAKSTNIYSTVWITGNLHADDDNAANSETLKLFKWAQIPAGDETAYRKVTVKVTGVNKYFREIKLNKAFVVDYNEKYSSSSGVGSFNIVIRQKADKVDDVDVSGGTPLEEDAFGAGGQETGAGQVSAVVDQAVAMTAPQSPATAGFAANSTKQNSMQAAIENTMRSTATNALQKTLKKADPSGAAAAVMQSAMQGVQAMQSPETAMQNGQAAKIMQKESFNEKGAEFMPMTSARIINYKE